MQNLLQGLKFKRVSAVDGITIDGSESRNPLLPMTYELLSRYERGCILSHRAVWREFLNGNDPYCCVLEDDVYVSPDFPRFINHDGWFPKNCALLKIETIKQEIFISRKTTVCLDRKSAILNSLDFGTAAYIISRRGAQILLEGTIRPARALDVFIFDNEGRRKLPSSVLFPALCLQANRRTDGVIFPELASSIQSNLQADQLNPPAVKVPVRRTLLNKIRRELFRPFCQLSDLIKPAAILIHERWKGVRRCKIPFA
jgi:glycosyl transferase family 25